MPNRIIHKTDFYLIEHIPRAELPLDFKKVTVKATEEYQQQHLCMITLPMLSDLFYYDGQEYTNIESHYSIYDTRVQDTPVTNNHVTYIGILTSDLDKTIKQSCTFIKIHIFTCPERIESISLVSFYSADRKKNKQYGISKNTTKPVPIFPETIRSIREQLMKSVVMIESALQKQAKKYQEQAEEMAIKIDRNTQRILFSKNNEQKKFINDTQKELDKIRQLLSENQFDFIQAKINQLKLDIDAYKKELSQTSILENKTSLSDQATFFTKMETTLLHIDEEQLIRQRWRKMEKIEAESEGLIRMMGSEDNLLAKLSAVKNFEKNYQSISTLFTFFDAWDRYLDYTIMQNQFMKDILYSAAREGNVAVLEQCEQYVFDAETINHVLIIATAHNQINVLMLCFSRFEKQSYDVMIFRLDFQNELLEQYEASFHFKLTKGDISLFHAAIIFNKPDVTRYLIQKGFPLNILVALDMYFLSYLDLAIIYNFEEIVRILLEENISIAKENGFFVNKNNKKQDIKQFELIDRARLVNSYCTALRQGNVKMLRLLQEYPQDPWIDSLHVKNLSMPSLLFYTISPFVPKEAIFASEELLTETTALFRKMPDLDKSNRNTALNCLMDLKAYKLAEFFFDLGAVHNAEPTPYAEQMFPIYSSSDILYKNMFNATEAFSEEQANKIKAFFYKLCVSPENMTTELSYMLALTNILAINYESKTNMNSLTSDLFDMLYERVNQIFCDNSDTDYSQCTNGYPRIMIGFIKVYCQVTSGIIQKLKTLEEISEYCKKIENCCLNVILKVNMRKFFCTTMFQLLHNDMAKQTIESSMSESIYSCINKLLSLLYLGFYLNCESSFFIHKRDSVASNLSDCNFADMAKAGISFHEVIELSSVKGEKNKKTSNTKSNAMFRGVFLPAEAKSTISEPRKVRTLKR